MESGSSPEVKLPLWRRMGLPASVALLLLVPLALWPFSTDIYNVPKFFLLQAAGLCLFFLWLTKPREKDRFTLTLSPLSLPLALFFLQGAVSLVGSQNPYAGGLLLLRLALLLLFFHFLLDLHPPEAQIDHAIEAILVTSIFISLYGLLQAWGIDFLRLERRFEPVSTLGNTSYAAEFLIIVLPLFLARILSATSLSRRLPYFLGFWLLLFYLFQTRCRGGWVAAAVAFLFMAVLLASKARRSPGFLSLAGRNAFTLLLLSLFFLALFLALKPESIPQGISRVRSIFDLDYPTNRVRILIWQGTLQMMRQHPWFGVGLGNFEYGFPPFRRLEEWLISERLPVAEAHNEYLHIGAEMGILGLLLFFWIVLSLSRTAARVLRRAPSPTAYLRGLAISASLVAILTYALFAFPLRNPVPSLYFWALLGYLAAQDKPLRGDRPPGSRQRISYLAIWPLAATLLAFSYLFTLQWFVGDLHLKMAKAYLARGQGNLALAQYQQAISDYFPFHHQYQLRSISLDEGRFYDQLIDRCRFALLSEPQNARLHLELGNALWEKDRIEEALAEMRKAANLDDEMEEAREKMGLIHLRKGDLNAAMAQFRESIRRHPQSARGHFFLGICLHRKGSLPEAQGEWEAALRLDPHLNAAQYWLRRTGRGANVRN